MSNIRLKNIDRFIDRHGKPRHYYRAGKGARAKLPGEPGSHEFIEAYERASAGTSAASLPEQSPNVPAVDALQHHVSPDQTAAGAMMSVC